MELTQVQSEVPLLQRPTPRNNFSCIQWLSIFSFVLLLVATTVLALLHFQIIPTSGNQMQDEFQVPEVFHIKTFLDSAPRTQALTGQRVAAHLTGKPQGDKIVWGSTPMNTFKTSNLKLKGNSLEIPQDGLYFVYTQVVYTGPDCMKMKSTDLTHTVNRKGEYEKVTSLLTSTITVCEVSSPSKWNQPIYQGGFFQLEEGDILTTETTNVELLNSNRGQVYFGVLAF